MGGRYGGGAAAAVVASKGDGEEDAEVGAAREVLGGVEMELIRDACAQRMLGPELRDAVSKGGVGGAAEYPPCSVMGVDTVEAERALAHAEAFNVRTADLLALVAVARGVVSLRNALLEDDLVKLEGALEEATAAAALCVGAGIADPAAKEQALCRTHLRYHQAVDSLQGSLSEGGAAGAVGAVDVTTVHVDGLDQSLRLAEDVDLSNAAPNSDLSRLIDVACIVRRLRASAQAGQWPVIERTLLENRDNVQLLRPSTKRPAAAGKSGAAKVWWPEVGLLRDEVNNRLILAHSTAALEGGSAKGSVGALDLASIRLEDLDAAVAEADRLCEKISLFNYYSV